MEAYEADQTGNLDDWTVPGGKLAGMGGAMDLVASAKKVIVATEHCTRDGGSKILKKCTFPLTGACVVDIIVTDLAYIEVTDKGLLLKETAPGVTIVIAKQTSFQMILHNRKPKSQMTFAERMDFFSGKMLKCLARNIRQARG